MSGQVASAVNRRQHVMLCKPYMRTTARCAKRGATAPARTVRAGVTRKGRAPPAAAPRAADGPSAAYAAAKRCAAWQRPEPAPLQPVKPQRRVQLVKQRPANARYGFTPCAQRKIRFGKFIVQGRRNAAKKSCYI